MPRKGDAVSFNGGVPVSMPDMGPLLTIQATQARIEADISDVKSDIGKVELEVRKVRVGHEVNLWDNEVDIE